MNSPTTDDLNYRRVEKAIRYLDERRGEQPTLEELSSHVGTSPFHLQRMFRRSVGISPKRFLQFLTAAHARRLLAETGNVMEASWGAGLSGPGRLHDLMVSVHAMTPAEVRGDGLGVELRWACHDTPVGSCVLGVTRRGIAALDFLPTGSADGVEALLADRWPDSRRIHDPSATQPWADRVFDGSGGEGPVSLHVRGTNFQVRVWEALVAVPPGDVVSYGGLARRMGLDGGAARAVGQAVAANPVGMLIPCHRVILSTGEVGGYRWGREKKLALLARERAGSGAA